MTSALTLIFKIVSMAFIDQDYVHLEIVYNKFSAKVTREILMAHSCKFVVNNRIGPQYLMIFVELF